MADRTFGVSTRLFRDTALTRDHLVHIAAHGFESVELYASPGHFDCTAEAVTQLGEWLSDTRMQLHSVHAAPAADMNHIQTIVGLANAVPYSVLVIHRPAGNTERTLEAVSQLTAAANVKVALEARNDRESSPAALIALLEDELDRADVGVCLDLGLANIGGDIDDAIETVSGHLVTTHVHDNGGRRDDRLVPYAGRIHWDTAMMELQKVGYDGALIFEYEPTPDPVDVLKRTAKARERLEQAFITF